MEASRTFSGLYHASCTRLTAELCRSTLATAEMILRLEFFSKWDRVNGTPLAEADEDNRRHRICLAKIPGAASTVTAQPVAAARVALVKFIPRCNEIAHTLTPRTCCCARHRWVVYGHHGIHVVRRSSSPLLCAAAEGLTRDIWIVDRDGPRLQIFTSSCPSTKSGGCKLANPDRSVQPAQTAALSRPR